MGVAWERPRGTAAERRWASAFDLGPGIDVFSCIVAISVPSDRRLVQIDVHLLGFEILLNAPGAEFAAKAGLLIAAPGRLYVGGLHVVDPHDPGAEGLEDVAGPDGSRETVGGVVGNFHRFIFVLEGNDGGNRAEDFFAGDAGAVVDVVEDGGLHVVALGELLGASPAEGHLGLLLADFKIGTNAVVLLFADQG